MSVVASVLVAGGYSTPQSETRSINGYQYNFEQYCRMLPTPNHLPIDVPLTRQHDARYTALFSAMMSGKRYVACCTLAAFSLTSWRYGIA